MTHMRYLILTILLFCCIHSRAQKIDLINLEHLKAIIESPGDKLKVINFWASWCRPCIMEMPYFEAIDQASAQVYFVTVDHPDDLEKALRMVQRNNIRSKVFLLDESDADKYITSINKDWTGAIPATLFVDARGRQYFFEKAFDKPELENFVKRYSSFNK